MSMENGLESISKVLEWAYEKAVTGGIPGTDSAYEMADEYMKQEGTLTDRVNSLIRWQNAKCATSGFITGLGGLITLPVTVPANVSSVIYIQLRMIAAIAIMGGHDIKDDKVKTLVFACLCGNSMVDVLKDVGIQVGKKLAEQALKNLSYEVIKKINAAVGFRLVTKFSQAGLVNLSKVIPLVGGMVSGTIDGISCNIIGNAARDTFIQES
ncbi:EcsC family protein [Paenibacillus alginolyticus]|uniref:EcsC family protein n=1 Tax=Paenibacillus alginolyticus TaxID=59839 RepID=UPI000408F2A6|nr:EcsC family protein [Paenibacillus alginolyticus]MCY9664904.1 EcsC family protein [Paenibacillus alginolyticus]